MRILSGNGIVYPKKVLKHLKEIEEFDVANLCSFRAFMGVISELSTEF